MQQQGFDFIKSPGALLTIAEVSTALEVPASVLRFWETQFSHINPLKIKNRRYYRPEDVDALRVIRDLRYAEGYTIKGTKRQVKQISHVQQTTEKKITMSQSPAVKTPAPHHIPSKSQPSEGKTPADGPLSNIHADLLAIRDLLKTYL